MGSRDSYGVFYGFTRVFLMFASVFSGVVLFFVLLGFSKSDVSSMLVVLWFKN